MNEVGQHPDEKRFEEHIEKHLNSIGFKSIDFNEYDRDLSLIPDEFISFIKESQPEKWESLKQQYQEDTEEKVVKRLSSEIGKHSLIHVLRNRLSDRGVHLDTFYRQPKSSLNPEHETLYKKNRFVIVRQLHFSPNTEQSVDIGLFLNGIPLLTIELKNQLTGQNIKHSENQYRYDRSPKEKLFNFKRCLVHFGVDNDKVSMTTKLSGKSTRFFPYNKGIENPDTGGYKSEYLWKEILTPDSLSDIIENFIHVLIEEEKVYNQKTDKIETKSTEVLIFPRFHQLEVVRKLREQIKVDGVGTNYLIQHTTGSGKSLEIGWLSHLLTSLYRKDGDTKRMFDSVIVITDRIVLDKQLQKIIKSLEQTSGVVKLVDKNSEQLKNYLESGKNIVVTTIQKFPFISETISTLGDRTFGVIIDEVHSSQSGERSKELKKSLSKLNIEVDDNGEIDYEDYIREEIKSRGQQNHISFFGFTGTPKEKTLEIFGTKHEDGSFRPFHQYTMYQSIHEGFTLDVIQNYTTFKRYFKIKNTQQEDIEIPSSEGKKELIRYVDSHEQTIRMKVGVILDHFINKGSKEIEGKSRGMIVVRSRKNCVKYFREVNKQLEERGLSYRSLVGFSSDIQGETEVSLNSEIGHKGDIPLGLKNPKYRLLIVSNKFQLGFDEPLIQSMYVDKKLGGVQCVQTLSRLNRVMKGKTNTFVLDFVNSMEEVIESFQKYYTTTLLTEETDPNKLYDYQTLISEYHLFTPEDLNRFCEVFFEKDRDDGDLQPLLNQVVEQYERIDEQDKKEEFKSLIQSYMRLYGYISQIMTFKDIELEKLFIFLRYLNKKLPKGDKDRIDISSSVDLDSLRIQKTFEGGGELDSEQQGELDPLGFEQGILVEDELELLSQIINRVNETYGSNLSEEDKIDLLNLSKRVDDNEELKTIMEGDSSMTNKKQYFKDTIDRILLSYVNERFDFYKKMEDQRVKGFVVDSLYENYTRNLNQETVG